MKIKQIDAYPHKTNITQTLQTIEYPFKPF